MKKNIAVIMGGYSNEYDISIKSGITVVKHLPENKYNIYPIEISKKGWFYVSGNNKVSINKDDFSINILGNKVNFDVVFNTIHGSPGEDGLMAAYFELLNIPQTCCNSYLGAITFNKRDLLSILKPYGIRSATSYHLNEKNLFDTEKIIKTVGFPCFIKANKSGSSDGVYKAYTKEELIKSIDSAFLYDNEILIESFLDGTEVSVGVITYKSIPTVLPITEIISKNDFFDRKAKYEGEAKEITPARLTSEQEQKIKTLALKIYRILGLDCLSRSEFIMIDDEFYLIEVNTTPGLTQESILPQQAKVMGISLEELFCDAIEQRL